MLLCSFWKRPIPPFVRSLHPAQIPAFGLVVFTSVASFTIKHPLVDCHVHVSVPTSNPKMHSFCRYVANGGAIRCIVHAFQHTGNMSECVWTWFCVRMYGGVRCGQYSIRMKRQHMSNIRKKQQHQLPKSSDRQRALHIWGKQLRDGETKRTVNVCVTWIMFLSKLSSHVFGASNFIFSGWPLCCSVGCWPIDSSKNDKWFFITAVRKVGLLPISNEYFIQRDVR